VELNLFLNSELDEGEWSVSLYRPLTPVDDSVIIETWTTGWTIRVRLLAETYIFLCP